MPHFRLTSVVIAALALGASASAPAPAPLPASDPWEYRRPERAARTGTFADAELNESSGVAASRTHPGVLWTIEDSHNGAVVFATDTLGRALRAIRLDHAANTDWEAIALGPCPTGRCLHVADIGDNLARRASVTIYRLPEPNPSATRASVAVTDSLSIVYPDGAHDAEGLFVTDSGAMVIVTKGRNEEVRAFRIPASAWAAGRATAEPLGVLPITTDRQSGRLVTDAALSPDGRRIAVRTYRDIYFFTRGAGDRFESATPGVACDIFGLEAQGEGVDWLDDSMLVLTTETNFGIRGGVSVARCPAR